MQPSPFADLERELALFTQLNDENESRLYRLQEHEDGPDEARPVFGLPAVTR